MRDPLLAAGDFQQLAIARLVPEPTEPGLGEGSIECRAMHFLGFRERAIDIEYQSLQHAGSLPSPLYDLAFTALRIAVMLLA